jgi:hypothetical protein
VESFVTLIRKLSLIVNAGVGGACFNSGLSLFNYAAPGPITW